MGGGGEGGIERKEDRFFSKIRFFSLSLVPLIVVNILLIEFAYIEYISLGLRNILYIPPLVSSFHAQQVFASRYSYSRE